MPLKRFDLPDSLPPPDEPTQFEIAGYRRGKRDPETGEVTGADPFVEQFTVVDVVPFACIDDLAMSVNIDDDGTITYGKHATLRFMRRVIVEADRGRWNNLITDPDRIVPIENVVEVMLWIVGETSDRPTGPRSSSLNGSADANDGSGVDSHSKAGEQQS